MIDDNDEWSEYGDKEPRLSARNGSGSFVSPTVAYAGLSPEVRRAAAIVDSVIWDSPGWAFNFLAAQAGDREGWRKTGTQMYLRRYGWRTVDDVYRAASLSKLEARAFNLSLLGYSYRDMAKVLDCEPHAAQMRVFRARESLSKIMVDFDSPGLPPSVDDDEWDESIRGYEDASA